MPAASAACRHQPARLTYEAASSAATAPATPCSAARRHALVTAGQTELPRRPARLRAGGACCQAHARAARVSGRPAALWLPGPPALSLGASARRATGAASRGAGSCAGRGSGWSGLGTPHPSTAAAQPRLHLALDAQQGLPVDAAWLSYGQCGAHGRRQRDPMSRTFNQGGHRRGRARTHAATAVWGPCTAHDRARGGRGTRTGHERGGGARPAKAAQEGSIENKRVQPAPVLGQGGPPEAAHSRPGQRASNRAWQKALKACVPASARASSAPSTAPCSPRYAKRSAQQTTRAATWRKAQASSRRRQHPARSVPMLQDQCLAPPPPRAEAAACAHAVTCSSTK